MPALIRALRVATAALSAVNRLLGAPASRTGPPDPRITALLDAASQARKAGRTAEATSIFRQVLERDRHQTGALRGLRELAVEAGRWADAVEPQTRLYAVVPAADRPSEAEWLAVIHYEQGRAEMGAGAPRRAIPHFRDAVRTDRRFVPATIALGDAYEAAGDQRESVRVWERGAEVTPVLPILSRLEQVYRQEGRPSRMIALYRTALDRAPDDLALGVALGRVYFELEMLDEAADQFEKIEVRAPDLPAVHAFLGAIFERRG
jgi:lipopolysaccharide biosynthesis regulator YciM